MSKRKPSSTEKLDSGPAKCKSTGHVQTTLTTYFQVSGPSGSKPEITVTAIPQDFGIHIYTPQEIEGGVGLAKEYRKYWNAKAKEYCLDKRLMSKMDGTAVKGAINTSWILHKSKLLLHQADELIDKATAVWLNKASRDHVLKGILRNTERVKMADNHLNMLYDELQGLTSDEERKSKETEMESAMTELRRAQDALHKAIDNKKADVNKAEEPHDNVVMTVGGAPDLTGEELEGLVKAVKIEQLSQVYESDHESEVSEKEAAELVPVEDKVYVDPFTKGVQFNATFISSVEVKSRRDNVEVREKVTKAIAANKPSSSVIFIVKPNTICIRNMIDHTSMNYLITQIVYCGAHVDFKDKFFFIHRSKDDNSLFARIYQLSDSDTVRLLTLTIAKAFKLSYDGWFSHVEKEIPIESPSAASERLSRAKSVPTAVLDRFSSSPWPSNSKATKNRRFSFGDRSEVATGNQVVYKVHTLNSRTGSVHSVSLTVDMDREFRELAQSCSAPSFLPTDLPATELNQFDLLSIKKYFIQ